MSVWLGETPATSNNRAISAYPSTIASPSSPPALPALPATPLARRLLDDGDEKFEGWLTLLSPEGSLIANVEVQVTPDVGEFKERLQQILPGERIEVRTANDGIVLSGTVSSTAKLDRALDLANRYAPDRVSNLMTVGGTQQVMLKVRFAEMQRSVSKSLSASLAVQGNRIAGETGTWLEGTNGIGNPIEPIGENDDIRRFR